ncbi:MAG: cadherin-like beta sandwich domain-containing protein, partial [Clostridiales bacterium]
TVEHLDSGYYKIYSFYPGDANKGSGTEALEDLSLNIGASYSGKSAAQIDLLPEFDCNVLDYGALIPYDKNIDQLTLRISVENKKVDLSVEGTPVNLTSDYYDYTFKVEQGENYTIDFTVDDEAYSLTIYLAAKNADKEAYLDDLIVRTKVSSSRNELTLSPAFAENKTKYTLENAASYKKLYLYPEADRDMVVLVNDQLLTDSYFSFNPKDYKNGKITITVYGADLEESTDYTIDFGSGSGVLSSLSLSAGLSLSPGFSAGRYNYVANVDSGISATTLNYTATGTVQISQNDAAFAVKTSGSSYNLNTGLNIFKLKIGSAQYNINIYRQSSSASITSSNQYLSLNNGASSQIAAYNINGNNFVKLRDVAKLLSGSAKQFAVGYNSSSRLITLFSGSPYAAVGGELT